MSLIHFARDADPDLVVGCLRENGYAIVDELASNELMDRVAAEMGPHIDATPYGQDHFVGKLTKRTGSMIARSPAARELVMNPLALAASEKLLHKASTFRLHLTQVISVYPGSPAQKLHQDEVAWDFFPFPDDYEIQCNLLWAMSDYTEEMGATRVVPGSQYSGRSQKYTIEESLPAVMKRGSALFYTGKVYHGAGANNTDKIRQAINITYAVGWVRHLARRYPEGHGLPDGLFRPRLCARFRGSDGRDPRARDEGRVRRWDDGAKSRQGSGRRRLRLRPRLAWADDPGLGASGPGAARASDPTR
jgi:ectoine hydroxylase-related dioxygenase (phytanoyl-CoA dioxygenase family)